MNKDMYIPRCRKCGHSTLTFYPSAIPPTMNIEKESEAIPKIYCVECRSIYSLSELPSLYVKL